MSFWKKFRKFFSGYHNDVCYLFFGLCLIFDFVSTTGNANKFLFGIVAVFFSVNWLRFEVRELREEIKKLK